MLVKGKEEVDHIQDLKETFNAFKRYNMKLNIAKCAFGVKMGNS